MSIPKFKIALVVVFLLTAVGAALYIHATPKAEAEPEQPPKRTAATENKPAEVPTQPIRTLSGHKDRVTSVAYSRDGRWLASAAWDGTVRLWDAASGKEIRKLDVPPPRDYRPAHISRVLFSPDGQYLIAAQQCMPNETGVIVWKRETGEKIHELRGGTGSVALSPDGKSIACGGYGVIHLHNLKSGLNIKELCGRQSHVESLAFSPDGKLLYATGPLPPPPSPDGIERTRLMPAVMRVWDIASGKECKSVLDKLQMSPLFQNNALSPDGRTLAVGAREISLREIATSVERVRFIGHVNDGEAVAFSRDGRTLASGNMDGTVRVWDLASGKELARFGEVLPKFAGRGWILCVAFSPDNRTLVAGTLDHVAQIWDVSNIMARPRALKERTPGELETDWKDLAGDSPTAFAAINRLVASPTNAVAFLEKQLQATKLVDANKVERLIADLGSEQFQTREKAMKALQLLGDLAAPALRKALAANPTAEARQRLLALLERLDGGSPGSEILRQIRAVEAQETIGNGDARRVLEKLAAGPAEARLTQEAKAALERMARRNPVGKR